MRGKKEYYVTIGDLTYIDEGERYRVCGYVYKSKMSVEERAKMEQQFATKGNYIAHGVYEPYEKQGW